LLSLFVLFLPLYDVVNGGETPSHVRVQIGPIFRGIGIIFYCGATLTLNRIQIKRAVLLSVIGSVMVTVIIIAHIMATSNLYTDEYVVFYPGFYWMFIPYIAIWVLTGYFARYINIVKCERCENIFTTDQLVECHQCGRKICENCLDKEYSICTACKTNYVMKLEVVEKSKPQQTQSQQVVIQQAPQIPVPQTPAPETSTNLKHCIHCGNMIKLAAIFCDKCGKEQ